jgi:hypothetical protein
VTGPSGVRVAGSALEKTAATLAGIQEDLERAADKCGLAASHADDVHNAAKTGPADAVADAVADAEDIRSALGTLRQHIQRTTATAQAVAGIVRAVIHGRPGN